MKRIVLTLCIFIALASLADAATLIECYDPSTGKTIKTSNPPPGAICEGMRGGGDYVSTPRDREQEIIKRIDEIKKINPDSLTPSEKQQLVSELLTMKAEMQQIQTGQASRRSGCEIVNFSQYERNVGVGRAMFAKTCMDLTIRNNDNVTRTITDTGIVAVTKKGKRENPKGFRAKIMPGGIYNGTVCFKNILYDVIELECEY